MKSHWQKEHLAVSVLTCYYYLAPLRESVTCQSQIQSVPLPIRWGRNVSREESYHFAA